MADTKFFVILITLLFFVTVPTALIIQSYNDWNLNKTEDFSSCPAQYGGYCPSPDNPTVSERIRGGYNFTYQNMTGEPWVVIENLPYTDNPAWIYNTGVGYISKAGTSFWERSIYFKYAVPQNNYYIINYVVNNTVKKPFFITIHAIEGVKYLELEFSDNAIKIPSTIPYLYQKTYDMPGLFYYPELKINTTYNPYTHHLLVSVNNGFALDIYPSVGTDIPKPHDYWGGIGTKDNGVTLTSFDPVELNIPQITSNPSSIFGAICTTVPFCTEITKFTSVLFAIINPFSSDLTTDLTGQRIVPWFLSVLIDIAIIGIIAYGITILRGN